MLIKRFADFKHDVTASEDRVKKVNERAQELTDAEHRGEGVCVCDIIIFQGDLSFSMLGPVYKYDATRGHS